MVFHIPAKGGVYRSLPTALHKVARHSPVGLALNGVKYDPPTPIAMIIKAHTIAPFDHSGGHVNPAAGYHYHAATDNTKEVPQDDNQIIRAFRGIPGTIEIVDGQ